MLINNARRNAAKAERQLINKKWMSQINEATTNSRRNLTTKDKEALARMCHTRQIFENAAVPNNQPGRGAHLLGNNPADGAAGFYGGERGSGEVPSNLFGVFMEVMAETIAFDLIPTVPMDKSSGTLYCIEPVYADGRLESATAKPSMIKVKDTAQGAGLTLVVGTVYTLQTAAAAGENIVDVTFMGRHRLDGSALFRLNLADGNDNSGTGGTDWNAAVVKDWFDNGAIYTNVTDFVDFDAATVDYVEGFTNFVGGYSGAGEQDTNPWFQGRQTGSRRNGAMIRQVGERTFQRSMALRTWSKNFAAETINVDIEFTREQIQDLNHDHGINALELGETVLQDQLSQHINDHILGDLFALGWDHHANMNAATGFNMNTFFGENNTTGQARTYEGMDGTQRTIAGTAGQLPVSSAISENLSTLQRRLISRITYASAVINNRGRRGRGDQCIMNTRLASALRDIRGYVPNPSVNDLNAGGLTFVGTLDGIRVYEDPLMPMDDNRICVSRKGTDTDPGLKFAPYILAEKTETIAEGTMAPKTLLSSRYSIVGAGNNTELSALTFEVEESGGYGLI
jgi:hypothetical protein